MVSYQWERECSEDTSVVSHQHERECSEDTSVVSYQQERECSEDTIVWCHINRRGSVVKTLCGVISTGEGV